MNKLEKDRCHSAFLVKFHGRSLKNFKYLKLSLDHWQMAASNIWACTDKFGVPNLDTPKSVSSWWKAEILPKKNWFLRWY